MLENPEGLDQTELEWATERERLTERYCPEGCYKMVPLPEVHHVTLEDGIEKNGVKVTIPINPYMIIRDPVLNQWIDYCEFAVNGLFPHSGGALDQDDDFLDYYKIYCAWKNIRKDVVQKEVSDG